MSLIEEQRENLTALSEPVEVEVSLKDYEQLDNLPKLNGETIIGNMTVEEAVEIWDSGTDSKYTAEELIRMSNNHAHFVYKGFPVVAYGDQNIPAEFYFTYLTTTITANMNVLRYVAKCKVQSNKKITEGTKRIVPFSVNGQSAGDNGNISLDIPSAQIQSDWEQSDNTALDYIKNKPSIPSAQVQADWDEADNTKADYIKNKPSLATVATTGDYDDLLNKPTIPTVPVTDVQVNGSSVVSSGVANITLPNYSTTEQDTGRKWINGETIYQKTYQGTTNPSYSAGSVTIDSFAGKNFLHGYGWCGQYSADSRIGVPAYLGNDYYSGLYYDEAGDKVELFYSRGLADSSYEITIFYTKTT